MAEAQPSPVSDAAFSQELLGEFLIQQSLVSPEQLDEAQARLATLSAPEAIPLGPAYVPASDGTSLLVFDQLLMVSEAELAVARWMPTAHAPRLGLIPTPEGGFLYTGEAPRQAYSPRLGMLPSPLLNPPGASGPIDLLSGPSGEYVVAVNRGAGTVHVVLTNSQEQRGAFSVRAAGHHKGIGVAASPDGRTLYLTDGLTPRLAILDVATFRVKHQLFPTGPLGSLVISADGSSLVVGFTKGPQEMGLMTLSLPDLRVRHLVNLPGKGEGDRPNLPFLAADEGPMAFLVSYSFETRDNQYLLAIDRSKHRVVKSHALKEMPLALCFQAPDRWCPEPPDLGDVLLEMGLVNEEHLRLARARLAAPGEDAPLTIGNVPINPSILSQLPERLIRDRGVIPLNQLDGQISGVKKAEYRTPSALHSPWVRRVSAVAAPLTPLNDRFRPPPSAAVRKVPSTGSAINGRRYRLIVQW